MRGICAFLQFSSKHVATPTDKMALACLNSKLTRRFSLTITGREHDAKLRLK